MHETIFGRQNEPTCTDQLNASPRLEEPVRSVKLSCRHGGVSLRAYAGDKADRVNLLHRHRNQRAGVTVVETAWKEDGADLLQGHPSHGPIPNNQSRSFHARPPSFVNIWRGSVMTNSVNASTSLSTVLVPPCCFVTMS